MFQMALTDHVLRGEVPLKLLEAKSGNFLIRSQVRGGGRTKTPLWTAKNISVARVGPPLGHRQSRSR